MIPVQRILDELSQTGIDLLLKEPFYAHIFSALNKEVTGPDHEVQTLAVGLGHQRITLFVNARFWEEELTSRAHRYGVLKHEMLHLVFRHLLVKGEGLDPHRLNIAFDLVVNQYIERSQLPDDSIFLESFPDLSLEKGQTWYYYYQKLQSEAKKEGGGSGQKGRDAVSEIRADGHGLERHQPWKEVRSRSEMENAVLDTHIDSLLRTAHQRANAAAWGSLPAGVRDALQMALPRPATLHWRTLLRRFTQSSRNTRLRHTLRRPSKRYGTTPGIRLQRRQQVLVAVDTSGSVGQPEFELFFNEIHHLWRSGAEITVVECDTAIHRQYPYKGKTPEWVQGRGGTDFNAPLELARQLQPDLLLYLTDGFAGTLHVLPSVPVIWLITPDGLLPTHPSWSKLPGRKIKMQQLLT